MVEIGGKPILWHIMKIYSAHGINDFVICCGYKGYIIKEYFLNYMSHVSDLTIDLARNETTYSNRRAEPWRITLVDTGEATMTGGRLRRVADHVRDEAAFCFTYGDGVADIDITASIAFHKAHGKAATITAVKPAGRYGALETTGDQVMGFAEKPRGDGGMINGGFFVLNPSVISEIADDATTWEAAPLETLAAKGELMAYAHDGFWQPMDTMREKQQLEEMWATGRALWRTW
jgi:glucose-1-phosphate cytidylyltransferase